MKVSAAIAEILKREGVDIIFGYPRNAVLEAAAEAGIRPIIVRQERTGLHMADAMSRLTRGRRMGVFAMQHGPGTENAYGGVAQAYSESVPVLVLPQGYARRLAHVPDNYNAVALDARHHQACRADHRAPARRRTSCAAPSPSCATAGSRPVLVEMPWDVLGEEVPRPLDYAPVVRTRSAPDPDAVRAAAALLVAAQAAGHLCRPGRALGRGL